MFVGWFWPPKSLNVNGSAGLAGQVCDAIGRKTPPGPSHFLSLQMFIMSATNLESPGVTLAACSCVKRQNGDFKSHFSFHHLS